MEFNIGDIVVVIDSNRFAIVVDADDDFFKLRFFDEAKTHLGHYSCDEIEKVA